MSLWVSHLALLPLVLRDRIRHSAPAHFLSYRPSGWLSSLDGRRFGHPRAHSARRYPASTLALRGCWGTSEPRRPGRRTAPSSQAARKGKRPARPPLDGQQKSHRVFRWATMRSVDCWPMASTHLQTLGGKPGSVAASGRDRLSVSSSLGVHVTVRGGFTARAVPVADHVLGNSVGAIGWLHAASASKLPPELGGAGLVPGCLRAPLPDSYSARCSHRVPPRGAPSGVRSAVTIVTWLILPVVICLSQRLSHACLSISTYTVKLRMAH